MIVMNQQKNTGSESKKCDSEGKNIHSEGKGIHFVITPCTQLNRLLSLNCQGFQWNFITPWCFLGRDTLGERGLSKKTNQQWRLQKINDKWKLQRCRLQKWRVWI